MNHSYKFILPALMAASAALAQAQVSVSRDGSVVTIGNQYLSRTFSIADGHLRGQRRVYDQSTDKAAQES